MKRRRRGSQGPAAHCIKPVSGVVCVCVCVCELVCVCVCVHAHNGGN